jgi:hypothetical protein
MNAPLLATLQQMQTELDALRAGHRPLAQHERQRDALFQALPPVFGEVWHNLLDRLESSALFAEESCSFSQTDLHDSLQLWLDKARARLATAH